MVPLALRSWLVGLLLMGTAAHAAEYEWRFALEEVQGSVQYRYAQYFKQRMAEKTDGRVQVTVYPYGALGTSAQLTELVHNGALQFAFSSAGHLGSVIPEVQVFSLHFLFSDDERVNQRVLARSRAIRGPMADAFAERGLALMAVVPEGWMVWTDNRPLRTPADLRGLKLRVMVSPLLLQEYSAYGANPTPMPYGEIYSALQLNMIDAQVNPVFAIEEMSFYEVQDYMIFPRHLPFIATVIANRPFLETLPADIRQALSETMAELDEVGFRIQRDLNARRLDIIRERSDIRIIELTEEERAAFRALSLPAREAYVDLAGPRGATILRMLQRDIRKAEAAQSASSEALQP